MRNRFWKWTLVGALVLALPAVCADTTDWSSLDSGTQALLAPWSDAWSALDTVNRARVLANAKRWRAMDAKAHDAFEQRSTAWQALPPEARARRRERYAAWLALSPDEQARVRSAAATFSTLPGGQKAALRASFGSLEANRQTDWLLGPSTGGWIEQARTAFLFVPDGERDVTMRMLQTLPVEARAQLFELAKRLPDRQRERLRKQLLGVAPGQRSDMLNQRMTQ